MIAAALSLWHREIVRFLGDRARVTSSLLQPVIFWVLFTGALDESFRPGDVDYGTYFFPGTVAMIALFTAIFATITVIEDRAEGFLQGVLVAPVPRAAIALGKIAGGATLGWILGLVFLLSGPLVGLPFEPLGLLASAAVLLLLAFAVTGMGFTVAWKSETTGGYHGIMMLVFMPMLLLSGAFFPQDGAHPVMAWVMACNPMTYGVAALRHVMPGCGPIDGLPSLTLSLLVTAGFAVLTFTTGTRAVLARSARDAA